MTRQVIAQVSSTRLRRLKERQAANGGSIVTVTVSGGAEGWSVDNGPRLHQWVLQDDVLQD